MFAGGTATFFTSPPDVYDTFGTSTQVEAKTDDRGVFRAELQSGVGRASVRLEPGEWFAFSTDVSACSALRFAPKPGEPRRVLSLTPLERMRVRFLGKDGGPWAGLRLSAVGTQWDPREASPSPTETLLSRHLLRTNNALLRSARTNAHGVAELRFLALPAAKCRCMTSGAGFDGFVLEPDGDIELQAR